MLRRFFFQHRVTKEARSQQKRDIKFRSLNAARNRELFQASDLLLYTQRGQLRLIHFQYHLNHNVIRNEYTLPTIREQPENSTVTFKDLHFSVLRQTGEADPFQTLKLADRCFQINSLTNYAQSSCQLFIKKNCTEKQ